MFQRFHGFAASVVTLAVACAPGVLADCENETYTSEFALESCSFAADGRNPFFSLEPGDRLVLEGEDEGEELRLEVTGLDRQRWVSFETPSGKTLRVRTRVVQEKEWIDGELVEVSRNFLARCRQTSDVFYFGEEVDLYAGGVIVGSAGAWLAGVDGALPGLIMPGRFLLGSRYFQEQAPGVALDRGEHTAMGLTVDLPAGTFDGCVEVLDTNALHCDEEGDVKVYCPGIGLAVDQDAELAEYSIGSDDDDSDDDSGDDDRWHRDRRRR
jgi:hypothetical protein